jgi:hypothetical protein
VNTVKTKKNSKYLGIVVFWRKMGISRVSCVLLVNGWGYKKVIKIAVNEENMKHKSPLLHIFN